MTGITKFDELRVKTAEQMIRVMNRELDLGIRSARQALNSADGWPKSAERAREHAEEVGATVARLMRLAPEVTAEERERLERKLANLREIVEALAVVDRAPTDASVAALARGLWAARGYREGFAADDWFQAERVLRNAGHRQAACAGC